MYFRLQVYQKYVSGYADEDQITIYTIYTNFEGQGTITVALPIFLYENSIALSAIEDSEAWKALFNCFTEDNALRLVEIVKDPRYQTYFDQNIKGKKKWITNKFKKLSIHSMNPKAKAIVEIHEEVLHTIDSFVKSKNETEFQKKWISFHKSLVSIKNFLIFRL